MRGRRARSADAVAEEVPSGVGRGVWTVASEEDSGELVEGIMGGTRARLLARDARWLCRT